MQCSPITGEPNALYAPIHNRRPVILDPADFPAWLGETPAAPEQLQALLRPFPGTIQVGTRNLPFTDGWRDCQSR